MGRQINQKSGRGGRGENLKGGEEKEAEEVGEENRK